MSDLLVDAFGRIRDVVHAAVDGLTAEELAYRVNDQANSIGWLVWHLTRVQDDHLADAAGAVQIWISAGWAERFALPFEDSATGYGQTAADVAALQVKAPELLTGYYDGVHDATVGYLKGLTDSDLARVVDRSWDPPVTLGVRLVSVISDDLQHGGQAAFLRGIIDRRRPAGAG